jgi:hypothetical protein
MPAVNDEKRYSRSLWAGIAFWIILSTIAVAVRGVRWDENYEFAQLITGRVTAPAGHPALRYSNTAFTLQTWLLAGMMKPGAGPALINGFRNVLYLLAGVLPAFLLTSRITGRIRAGHLAALLVLEGVLTEFDGVYPIGPWPWLYSNGHIGGGWALIGLYALAAGHWRLALFFAALLPVVHIGQAPVLFAAGALYGFWLMLHRQWAAIRRALPWALPGLLAAALLVALIQSHAAPPPETGPYAVSGNETAIWQGYVARHDPHRRFPDGNGHLVMIGALLLLAPAWYRENNMNARRVYGALLIYTAGTAACVWLTMALHARLRPEVPMLLLGWLPYRLINHIPWVLLAAAAGQVWRNPRTRPLLPLALIFAMARPLAHLFLAQEFYRRYLFPGDAILFGLYGAALAVTFPPKWRPGSGLALAAVLGMYHQFGAACLAAGLIAALALQKIRFLEPVRLLTSRAATGAVIAVCVFLQLLHQGRHREHLPVDTFQKKTAAVLAETTPPDAPLITPQQVYAWQAKTGRIMLADAATASLLSYLPALGPPIQQIHEDLYGYRFDQEKDWQPRDVLWRDRRPDAWRELGLKYGAFYVASPGDVLLQLPAVVQADGWTLYRIPGR